MSLYHELKRRNVFRVAIAYLALAWLVTEVASTLFPTFGIPDWGVRFLVIVFALGLVPALIISWVYEITPEGLKREKDVVGDASITRLTARRLDLFTIGLIVVALTFILADRLWLNPRLNQQSVVSAEVVTDPVQTPGPQPAEPDYPPNAIAVLPFVNMSDDAANEYFADGIAEELLSLLTKIPELRVTSHSSAFAFKGEKIDIPEVAKKLKVANILEGSVRKAGNKVRITAQLVKASDGYHLWSETYDRELDNIFAIQDEIAATVVDKLKITLLGETPKTPEVDPEAYALYLQARYLNKIHTPEAWEQSNALIDQALTIDPDYAAPWSLKSSNYSNMTNRGLYSREEGSALARQAAKNALAIDPGFAEAYGTLGWVTMVYDADFAAAAGDFERALALAPANVSIISNSATFLLYLRRYDAAIALREYVIPRNPLSAVGYYNLGVAYIAAGRLEEAESALETTLRLSPNFSNAHLWLGKVLLLKGEAQAALEMTQKESSEVNQLLGQAFCFHELGRIAESDVAMAVLIETYEEVVPYEIASIWAYRNETEKTFEWIDKAVGYRDTSVAEPLFDPFFANVIDDPRWQQFLESIGKSKAQLDAIKFKVTLPK
jgi:TolB-like protein